MKISGVADCVFCRIINKEIDTPLLYEDQELVVFKDINPKSTVHLLTVPKLHIKDITEFNPTNKELMFHIIDTLPKIAKNNNLKDGFRTIINTGLKGGQTVFHFHIHILGGNDLPAM